MVNDLHAWNLNKKMKKKNRVDEFTNVSKEVLGEENIQSIVLFGSSATGTDTLWSDYDFYIVTRKEFGWDEKFEIYQKLDFDVDIVFRTYPEMKGGILSFSSIDVYALYYGEIVYGEELDAEKKEVLELLRRREIILRPELGKGVIEYGTRLHENSKKAEAVVDEL